MKDFSEEIAALRSRHADAAAYLKIDDLRARQPELEHTSAEQGLWDDPERARKITGELAAITEDLEVFDSLTTAVDDAATLYEMAREEADESLEAEITEAIAATAARFDQLELRSLFTGEHDDSDAVCHIQSGEGGTDAQDWAEMLLRMYTRWAEQNGFTVEIEAVNEGAEAGLTSCEFIDQGPECLRSAPQSSTACIGWCGSHRSTRKPSARRRSPRCTWCRSSTRWPTRSTSTRPSCASTPTGRRAQAVSTSTSPIRRCASPTCRPASS